MPKKYKIVESDSIVPIDQVHPNDFNPKLDFKSTPELQKEFDRIVKSLETEGQIAPITVREVDDGYEIIDGYHRHEAMKLMGYKQCQIKNLGKLSWDEAVRALYFLEATGVPVDPVESALLLKKYKELGHDINALPYSVDEINSQIEVLNYDFNHASEGPEERKLKEITCPECNHTFTL